MKKKSEGRVGSTLYLKPELKIAARKFATQAGVSLSQFIEDLINEELFRLKNTQCPLRSDQ